MAWGPWLWRSSTDALVSTAEKHLSLQLPVLIGGWACGMCVAEHSAKVRVRKCGSCTRGWFMGSVLGAAEDTTKETAGMGGSEQGH